MEHAHRTNRFRASAARPSRRAFTLIELLVVMGILGLLMAILLPSLSAARQTAKTNVCLSHLKGLGNAFSIYLNENQDDFPPVRLEQPRPNAAPGVFYVNEFSRVAPRWQWFLQTDAGPVINPDPFEESIQSFGYFYDGSSTTVSARAMTTDVFTCPALVDDEFATDIRDGAYGYNYQYLGNTYQETTPGRWDNFAVGRHRIRHPAGTVVIADSRGAGTPHGKHSYTLDPPRLGVEVRAVRFGPRASGFDAQTEPSPVDLPSGLDPAVFAYSPAEARHRNMVNALFADMHADAKSLAQLGYELSDGEVEGVPKNTPLPVRDPTIGTYKATNKLFNGEGSDQLAYEHLP